MKWLKAAGAVLLAVLLAMVGMNAAQKEKRAEKKDAKEAKRLSDGITKHLEQSKKLKEEAYKATVKGVVARKDVERKLKDLETADAKIDSIAKRSNAGRVRRKPKTKRS